MWLTVFTILFRSLRNCVLGALGVLTYLRVQVLGVLTSLRFYLVNSLAIKKIVVHICKCMLTDVGLKVEIVRNNKFHEIFLEISLTLQPFNDQCSHHIETSQLICYANQLTGFYMVGTLVVKGLMPKIPKWLDTLQNLTVSNL